MCSLADKCVIAHDLRRGIPFADESFEVVYHSHVLEHLPQVEAHRFLCECCRVLTPGGTMRVVVPDLEEIARLYLRALELARQGDRDWQDNYEWMMIELYDQTIREVSGGGHGAYLNRPFIPNRAFVLMRHGREAAESIAGQERARAAALMQACEDGDRAAQRGRFTRRRLLGVLQRLRRTFSPQRSSARREARIQRLLGDEYELLQLGRFRRSGEVHQWMYDSYSLSRAVVRAGFVSPQRMGASQSRVGGWAGFCLDTEPDGQLYKPDSLYLEAVKGTAMRPAGDP